MPKKHTKSEAEALEIAKVREGIRDTQTDKRFRAAQLRGEGKTNSEIAEILETTAGVVSHWIGRYAKGGMEALWAGKCGGKHWNMNLKRSASYWTALRGKRLRGK